MYSNWLCDGVERSSDSIYLILSLRLNPSWHVSRSDGCATISLWSLEYCGGRRLNSSGMWRHVVGAVFADVSKVLLQPLNYWVSGIAFFVLGLFELEDLGTTSFWNVGNPPPSDTVSYPEDLSSQRHLCENLKSRSIKVLFYPVLPDDRKSII